ncbi:hypothetical protein [Haloplasma contractile]|uniref:Uncharacterized protein n=1 Tax=Haloplasma contractile SSD-17B TaxID=1033810 RepID=U2EEP4_9MOLU|nr:hypothetical protein [Haloplasma contractile]ERJ13171.1 hypothetical protein HLPCO_000790 [Haloplasma contractile SSD-17B]
MDLVGNLEVKIDDVQLNPETDVDFKSALKTVIKKSTYNERTDKDLDLYYNILTQNENFENQLTILNSNYFYDKYTANQYQLTFEPGEIKQVQVSYELNPSYYYTKTDHYNTYKFNTNKRHWQSYNEAAIVIELNEHYKYIPESTFDITKVDGISYHGEINNNTMFSFSTFTKDEVPEKTSNFDELGNALGRGLAIAFIAVLAIIAVVTVSVAIIIIFIIKEVTKKRNNNSKIE